MAGGAFSEATQSRFNARNGVLNIVSSAASLTSLTQCLVSGRASTSVALITLGTNVSLNANDNTIQNLDTTTEVNNTSRYIYTTGATGNLVVAIRNNITNSTVIANTRNWISSVGENNFNNNSNSNTRSNNYSNKLRNTNIYTNKYYNTNRNTASITNINNNIC
jgi:hypothetical protein